MKQIIILYLVMGCFCFAEAQTIDRSVIGSAGASLENTSGQLDYSVGELVTLTASNTSTDHITQGFIQPIRHSGTISVFDVSKSAIDILAYPNPVREQLNIKITGATQNLTYTIVDLAGKQVAEGELTGFNDVINTSELAAAGYMLKITSSDLSIRKTIRFSKM